MVSYDLQVKMYQGWLTFLHVKKMIKEFNTYLEKVDTHYWSKLCKETGTLRKFKAGEEIVPIGSVGQFLGLIKSGTVKYAAYSSEGEEKIIGLEAADGFAATWPFSLRYEKILQRCPKMFDLFTFRDIASLLIISTQHLFRIREGLE